MSSARICSLLAAALPLVSATPEAAPSEPGHGDGVASPQRPVGFRGNWTGRYLHVQPPTDWSLDGASPSALEWKAEVGVGESSAIVVGGKAFIVTDGIRLSCLRLTDGRLLWQRDRHVADGDAAGSTIRRIEQYVSLRHRHRAAKDRLREVERRLRGGRNVQASAEGAGRGVLEADAAQLRGLIGQLDRKVSRYPDVLDVGNRPGQTGRSAPPHGGGALSYPIATPCSDGKSVYAWLPTGFLAAYDLEGRPLWVRVLGDKRAAGGWFGGQVAPSPVLADGKIVVHYDLRIQL